MMDTAEQKLKRLTILTEGSENTTIIQFKNFIKGTNSFLFGPKHFHHSFPTSLPTFMEQIIYKQLMRRKFSFLPTLLAVESNTLPCSMIIKFIFTERLRILEERRSLFLLLTRKRLIEQKEILTCSKIMCLILMQFTRIV